uniref:Uncharacterized protein n=1 Tax=Acrobeloides nanus TaxID=290746 RepID=A0A914CVN0_9BILA
MIFFLKEIHKAYPNLGSLEFKNSIDILNDRTQKGLEKFVDIMKEYVKVLEEIEELPFKITLYLFTYTFGNIQESIRDGTLADFLRSDGYAREPNSADLDRQITEAEKRIQVTPNKECVAMVQKKLFGYERERGDRV